MKKLIFVTFLSIYSIIINGQDIKLTDNLLFPRLDSTYWMKDYDELNKVYSNIANRCQTCVYQQTDSTRGRFCLYTTLGHTQMDTTLHNFPIEKLIGKWEVVRHGELEIKDSLVAFSNVYLRSITTISEAKNARGIFSFTDKRFVTNVENMIYIPNKNKRYKIKDGRFLTVRTLNGFCGATIIGITKEGYLILDNHTYRTLAKKDKYLVVKTTILRTILKK